MNRAFGRVTLVVGRRVVKPVDRRDIGRSVASSVIAAIGVSIAVISAVGRTGAPGSPPSPSVDPHRLLRPPPTWVCHTT